MLFADIDEIIDRTPEEKPMPDNEIIEALECCSNPNNTCEKCPLYVASDDGCECAFKLRINALDLINRLKAEKSNLTSNLTSAKAEIERLKKEVKKCKEHYKMACSERNEFLESLETAKAEAAEEFAEMLKGEMLGKYCMHFNFEITNAIIDNILKERLGERV